MKKRNVIILRGVSGTGKTTFAKLVAQPAVICTADDFYYDDEGNYNFVADKIGEAHGACMAKFDKVLHDVTVTNIVVANTNCKAKDYKYYVKQAEKAGLNVTYIVMEKRHDNENTHGVPDFVLERQEENLRNSLKLS